MTVRGSDVVRLAVLIALSLAGCSERRVVLFGLDSGPGSDGALDGSTDTLVLDASSRDPERCGAEALHCEDDEYCVDGVCACRQGLVRVDGEDCVDLGADRESCGSVTVTCPEVCADGACASSCSPGQTDCEGGCVDVTRHPSHCGECGRPCGAGSVCSEGSCAPFRPAACASCPCDLCGTRLCCLYPGTSDPICVDGPSCAVPL